MHIVVTGIVVTVLPRIMIMLSIIPNPMKGTPALSASRYNCSWFGSVTAAVKVGKCESLAAVREAIVSDESLEAISEARAGFSAMASLKRERVSRSFEGGAVDEWRGVGACPEVLNC